MMIAAPRIATGVALALAALGCITLAAPAAQARTGAAGWQAEYAYTVPTGLSDLFFHYPCPSGFPIARSGGFQANVAAKPNLVLTGNSPRLDLNPTSFTEWSWNIEWPNGAPAGAVITFDVYCTKGPA